MPFRLMDLRNVLDAGGFQHDLPQTEALYRSTLLHQRPLPHYLTNADVYCLTHAIFYVTDFGAALPGFVGPDDLTGHRTLVEQLLGLFVRLGDWDLTSELLLCRRCLISPPVDRRQRRMGGPR